MPMTWLDISTALIGIATIIVVIRSGAEVKKLLAEARYERVDINRRLERLARRLEKIERDPEPADFGDRVDQPIQPATAAAT